MERLLAYQGPVVNADHSHRVAAPTEGCDEDLRKVRNALDRATKLKDRATLFKDIRTRKLNECLKREHDDEEEKRDLEEQMAAQGEEGEEGEEGDIARGRTKRVAGQKANEANLDPNFDKCLNHL